MIPIPVGRRYSSNVSGWVWRPVHCEHCGCEFAYKMQIVGVGRSSSPLYLNNAGAKASASSAAQANFYDKLQRAFIAVECPQCGSLQRNMIGQLKGNRWRLLIGPGITFAAAFLLSQLPYYGPKDVSLCFGGVLVWFVCIALFMYKGFLQCVYPVCFLAILVLRAANVIDLVPLLIPLGIIILLSDVFLALRYDP